MDQQAQVSPHQVIPQENQSMEWFRIANQGDKEKRGAKRRDDSPSREEGVEKRARVTSSIFTNPINEIKTNFFTQYQLEIDDATELSREIKTILADREQQLAVLKHNDNPIAVAIQKIRLAREYCDLYDQKIMPLIVLLNKLGPALLTCVNNIRLAAGCDLNDQSTFDKAFEHTHSLVKIGGKFAIEKDQIFVNHFDYLDSSIKLLVVNDFEDQQFEATVLSVLETENRTLHAWANHWLQDVNQMEDMDDVEAVFALALKAKDHFPQNGPRVAISANG